MFTSAFCALFLSLGLSPLGSPYFAEAGKVNITVDDTDSSIIYEPTTAWFFSGNASGCAVCLTPPPSVAYNNTWHQGLNIPATLSGNNTNSDALVDGASKKRNDRSDERRSAPDVSRDVPVSVQLNFTGSAIYLYCILPLGKPPNADSPTLTNLTFTLDSEPAGNFLHSGSATNQGFQSTVSVFSRGELSDSTHTLLVNLEPNSVFLFDYYVVSRDSAYCSDTNPCPTQTQAPTTNAHKHNIGAIAGAAVGSIAVFVMLAACLEFSIRRRRRSGDARRQMRDRDHQVEIRSVHSDISGHSSLLPRYFPPNAPPPYVGPAEESSVATQSELSSIEMYHQTSPPFGSTPSQPATGAIPHFVTYDREPSDSPPPVSSASPPVYTGDMPRTTQQISPQGHTKDTEPTSVEVAPILLTAAIVPPSRPTRILRRSRSSSLPYIDTATTSSGANETRPLSAKC